MPSDDRRPNSTRPAASRLLCSPSTARRQQQNGHHQRRPSITVDGQHQAPMPTCTIGPPPSSPTLSSIQPPFARFYRLDPAKSHAQQPHAITPSSRMPSVHKPSRPS
ncbi:hypothetical protein ACLOJK_037279, partial [Asimina triloba]